jgi:hypothetical protein
MIFYIRDAPFFEVIPFLTQSPRSGFSGKDSRPIHKKNQNAGAFWPGKKFAAV